MGPEDRNEDVHCKRHQQKQYAQQQLTSQNVREDLGKFRTAISVDSHLPGGRKTKSILDQKPERRKEALNGGQLTQGRRAKNTRQKRNTEQREHQRRHLNAV
ncbi:hypothetical protein GCM10010914_22600 [Deinococcus wulumuqiensis]|uniref:Uncharacterized protein n=1 Tax=Deinococcus wulumuqiensis TaxID=980427 RepID=A0AAV4K9Z9_9DEIO|nr:hypothetical protein GCM10010914_22600 [Deinococcus wulumuqiensis]GGP30541.1 hypothetical protein GCM10008021_21920 [Deinococcus wulumuqiensis]